MRFLMTMVIVISMAVPVMAGNLFTIPTDGNGNPGAAVLVSDGVDTRWVSLSGDSTGAMAITGNISVVTSITQAIDVQNKYDTAPLPVEIQGRTDTSMLRTLRTDTQGNLFIRGNITANVAPSPSTWQDSVTATMVGVNDSGQRINMRIDTDGAMLNYIYGWNGTSWSGLQVYSAAAPNLKMQIYYGANPIAANSTADRLPVADFCLQTIARLFLYDTTLGRWNMARGDTIYGVDVDVTRLPTTTVNVFDTSAGGATADLIDLGDTNSWTIYVTSNDSCVVGFAATTNTTNGDFVDRNMVYVGMTVRYLWVCSDAAYPIGTAIRIRALR